jgi:flagellar basal-body rod protein FlgC
MDYLSIFDISASGMMVEKTRLDVVAMNLANIHTTHGPGAAPYKPMRVISAEGNPGIFTNYMDAFSAQDPVAGVQIKSIQPMNISPRMVYEPQHPDANEKGFVAYPNINPMSEMVSMMETLRSYEANVRALNAAKTMAQKALEIGGQR